MVENLLSITRINSGEVKIIKTPIVLDELIDSVIVKFKKRYPKQYLNLKIPNELIIIPMDAILIEQVLLNILENAINHAKNMTTLTLEVTKEINKVFFKITDDGCGISEDRIDDLFKGYYRKDEKIIDGNKGNAGIGLSVCATIINAHGGEIKAYNNHKGVTFMFTLDAEENNGE